MKDKSKSNMEDCIQEAILKMYASAKYHCCRNNSYWETDLDEKKKLKKSHLTVKYRS